MKTTIPNSPDYVRYQALNAALLAGAREITLSGKARFTKTKAQQVEQSLQRDFALESSTKRWFDSRADFSVVCLRVKEFDQEYSVNEWPRHYAFRIPNQDSNFGNRENVFIYFPFALGLKADRLSEIFSVELIDVSSRIYTQVVFPAAIAAFSNGTQLKAMVEKTTVDNAVFLYSVFHEIAHQMGPWRATPDKRPEHTVSGFSFAVLGELSADLLVLDLLRDFPEVRMATLLIRLFWYARVYDSTSDNDAWIGKYFWKICEQQGALTLREGQLELDPKKLPKIFSGVLTEVLAMGQAALASAEGAKQAAHWVLSQSSLPFSPLAAKAMAACSAVPTKLVRTS